MFLTKLVFSAPLFKKTFPRHCQSEALGLTVFCKKILKLFQKYAFLKISVYLVFIFDAVPLLRGPLEVRP